ncbi:MAG: hypothetical protein KAY24_01565 [Candidatus Eisenbacteria sp.]|nr:hypothetical protein [Candidatus Eisenbacteria bacterium]
MRYLTVSSIVVLTLCSIASGATYVVQPDGAGDFPTIQAAIDASEDGDIIELTDGTFIGDGNRDIDFKGKAITVRSQEGNPEACIIDCEGSQTEHHCGFQFSSDEGHGPVLEGVTITNGYDTHGGGVGCSGALLVANCIFLENTAAEFGGGMVCGGEATLTNCIFVGNSALSGGGLCCHEGATVINNCTFSGNWAGYGGGMDCWEDVMVTNCTFCGNTGHVSGGGIYCGSSSSPSLSLENTIIAFSIEGEAVYCHGSSVASLSCCDVYGNAGGDWVGCLASQYGANGNIWENPQFCSPVPDEHMNWKLQSDSPCAPEQSGCGLIGAWGVGCGNAPTQRTTWGALKGMFQDGD